MQYWVKTLLQQGISETIFYDDLVYKFKQIVGKPNFSDQFKKIVKRYIRVGYNLDIMQQSACLVLNPTRTHSMASHGKSPRSGRNLMVIDPLTPFQGHPFDSRLRFFCVSWSTANPV